MIGSTPQAQALTFNFSGNLSTVGTPTWNARPAIGNPPTGTSSGTRPYNVIPFTVDTTASGYDIIGRWRVEANGTTPITDANPLADGFLALYQTLFDPTQPLLNIISADDDAGEAPVCPNAIACSRVPANDISNFLSLTAGTQYFAVVSNFTNSPTDSSLVQGYKLEFNTPGNAVVNFGSPTPVPEPLTIMGTLLAGGLGIALKKKKDSLN